ncbi:MULTISPECIES: hypothetical protein [unclassified Microcoleus]|uniref:hypothetical protein n=1 Tax=unclassified Microcoleus TaxID=2642155 RepID=UPI002FCEBD6B
MAATTRQAVQEKIAGDRTLMLAYHFLYPGIGHLRARAIGVELSDKLSTGSLKVNSTCGSHAKVICRY